MYILQFIGLVKIYLFRVFLLHDVDDDHGVCRADTAQALAWWQRIGALHEATNMLHRAR